MFTICVPKRITRNYVHILYKWAYHPLYPFIVRNDIIGTKVFYDIPCFVSGCPINEYNLNVLLRIVLITDAEKTCIQCSCTIIGSDDNRDNRMRHEEMAKLSYKYRCSLDRSAVSIIRHNWFSSRP